MRIGKREFDVSGKKSYLAAILNITPDSFSDGGKYLKEGALRTAERLIEEGADILDVGAQSTRPGAVMVSEEEECERLIPVLKDIKRNFDIPVSVDTFKCAVAKAALEEGADMLNDECALKTPGMPELLAGCAVPIVLMHSENLPYGQTDEEERALEVTERVRKGIEESIAIAEKAGIAKERLILDPGMGFHGGTPEDLKLLKHLSDYHALGLPLYLGVSRKSVIGNTLKIPVEERDPETALLSVLGAQAGCSFIRVHNVALNRRALDLWEAIEGST